MPIISELVRQVENQKSKVIIVIKFEASLRYMRCPLHKRNISYNLGTQESEAGGLSRV